MQADWELSQSFTWDGQGVRDACALPVTNDDDDDSGRLDRLRFVAGNQGGGLCEFGIPSGTLHPVPFQHDHAVTAVLSSSSSSSSSSDDTGEDLYYVTGCKDAAVRVFDGKDHKLIATLTGHEKPVTSLAWAHCNGGRDRFLVSGSWDGTAKVWNVSNKSLVTTLSGHENSVCVTGLSSNETKNNNILAIATGSAGLAQNGTVVGHTVRIWEVNVVTGESNVRHQLSDDHDGPIRDIVSVSSSVLASCSNDGTVKLRSAETGVCYSTLTFVQEQQQHPPMLLSVCAVDDGSCLVASAEDGHVVVWDLSSTSSETSSGTSSPQIVHHASCVWNVTALPGGDFATCCQDGVVRVFTRSTENMASAAERDAFQQHVSAALQKQKSGPSSEEVSKLPRWEDSGSKRGSSEGQVQLFQKDGVAIAAQWSAASQTWIEVGQVMGSAGDSDTIDGVKYDHVFPIEVDQTGGGVAKLRIGYNDGENPFVAAQRFIDQYQLPQHHLAEIADYITQRAGHKSVTLGGGGGGGGATPAATTGVPIASFQYVPACAYKTFGLSEKAATTTLEKMKTKISEAGRVSETQLSDLSTLMGTLAAGNRYHATKVRDAELNVLTDMLRRLEPADAFPALDLARLAVLHPDAASRNRAPCWSGLIQRALELADRSSNDNNNDGAGPAAIAIPMLSLRLFGNAFKGGPGSLDAVTEHLDAVLACANRYVQSSNKNVRLSVATVLYNACYYIKSDSAAAAASTNFVHRIIPTANAILSSRLYEGEATFRTLVALGTVLLIDGDAGKAVKDAANAVFLTSKVEPAASPHGDPVKAAAKEVYSLLQ